MKIVHAAVGSVLVTARMTERVLGALSSVSLLAGKKIGATRIAEPPRSRAGSPREECAWLKAGGACDAVRQCQAACLVIEEQYAADNASFDDVTISLVDLLERIGLRDEFVELEFAHPIEFKEARDIDLWIGMSVDGSHDLLGEEHELTGVTSMWSMPRPEAPTMTVRPALRVT